MTDSPPKPPAWERLRWFGQTDRGKVRANNEDAFLGLQIDAQEARYLGKIGESSLADSDLVFAISDGMGGSKAGEFASRIAVDKITLLPSSFKRSASGLALDFEDVFIELFDNIHKALNYLGWSDPDCHEMGATLSLCWFTPGWMYFAHIGDSRIYYLPARDGTIKQLSHDDTYVGWLFRQGKITEREARNHPARNRLQKALGAGNQFVTPHVGAVGYEPGDMFLLCTDGLTEGLYDDQLRQIARFPEPAEAGENPAVRLVRSSVERAGHDNTSAIVVEIL